jgi:hypothetical protein
MRSLASEYRRKRSRITSEMSLAVTARDLEPFLGKGWGICRKTPANLERYERCITHAEYEDAVLKAFELLRGAK